MQNNQTYTPKFKRRNTFNQFYHSNNKGPRQERERNKTHYNLQLPKNLQDQYADLALESVKKNYLVGNLKPFAVDKNVFKEQKSEVSGLKQVSYQNTPQKKTFYDSKQPISDKLSKILSTALGFKQKVKLVKKRKNHLKSEIFIQSLIEDDHENLMEDYREQVKHERVNREKTIQHINNHLIKQYSTLIEKPSNINKNKIIKFKKSSKVAKIYTTNDNLYKSFSKNYNEFLGLEKSDYGIYSRSANRAIYYEKKKQIDAKDDSHHFDETRISAKFYKSYLGSYSQRKDILRKSQISLKS